MWSGCAIAFFLTFSTLNAAEICNKYCDGISAEELPNTFEFLSTEEDTFARRLEIHGQREGGMVFAKILKGIPGDKMWLERSWDFGVSWNSGRLGEVTIANGSTEVTSKAFNVDGDIERTQKKQIGVIRVCAIYAAYEDKTKCTDMFRVPICIKLCDNSDRSQVTNPVVIDRHSIHRRPFEALSSGEDRVIYGRLHNAKPGDEIWLDRSWNDGVHWRLGGKLGHNFVKNGSTEAFTTAFNVDDKIGSPLIGLIRVCAYAAGKGGVACTVWLRPPNCNKFCDNTLKNKITDPDTVAHAELHSRSIEVIASRVDNVAYGRLSDGAPKDEIWLDRTFDNGLKWDGHLGERRVADGKKAVETSLYNYDVTRPITQLGKIRACGKAFGHDDVICSEWTRPPEASTPEPVRLVGFEDCIISILEYMRTSGDSSFSRFVHISTEEAVYEFKKSYCRDYGILGNCHKCFREVTQGFK